MFNSRNSQNPFTNHLFIKPTFGSLLLILMGLLAAWQCGDPGPCDNNAPPRLTDDKAFTALNTEVVIDVLANDTDDGELTINNFTPSDDGFVNIGYSSGDGAGLAATGMSFTPNDGFVGITTFTYTAADECSVSRTANVTVEVTAGPVALDDEATTPEQAAVTIDVLANDSHPSSLTFSLTGNTGPSNGALSASNPFTYTPDPDFVGEDTFTYTITDENGETDDATVTITVEDFNFPPTANDDSAETDEGLPVTIDVLANDSDPDGDDLNAVDPSSPSNGSVATEGNQFVYTPAAEFVGEDSFTYTATDGENTAEATVTITVNAVNAPPIARRDTLTVPYETSGSVAVLDNDRDPDGDFMTVTNATNGLHGITTINANGSIGYTPDADYSGPDSFTYTISDGNGHTASAGVLVTVQPKPDPVCGDGVCTFSPPWNENTDNCPADCPCNNNGICDHGEGYNCLLDACIPPAPLPDVTDPCQNACGNGTCQPVCGENYDTCPADCPDPCANSCGNETCEPACGEDYDTCPADCEESDPCENSCGNNVCDYECDEDTQTCPQDCGGEYSAFTRTERLKKTI